MSKESAGGKWDIEGYRRGGDGYGGNEVTWCDEDCLGAFKQGRYGSGECRRGESRGAKILLQVADEGCTN